MKAKHSGQLIIASAALFLSLLIIASYSLISNTATPTYLLSLENSAFHNHQVQRTLSDKLSSFTQNISHIAEEWCKAHYQVEARKREVILPYKKPLTYNGSIKSDWTASFSTGLIMPRGEKTFEEKSPKILSLKIYGLLAPSITIHSSNFSQIFYQDAKYIRLIAYKGQPKILKISLTVAAFEASIKIIELRLYDNGTYKLIGYDVLKASSFDDIMTKHRVINFNKSHASKTLLIVAVREIASHGGWFSINIRDQPMPTSQKIAELDIKRDITMITDGVVNIKPSSSIIDYYLIQLKRSKITVSYGGGKITLPPGEYPLIYNSFTGQLLLHNLTVESDRLVKISSEDGIAGEGALIFKALVHRIKELNITSEISENHRKYLVYVSMKEGLANTSSEAHIAFGNASQTISLEIQVLESEEKTMTLAIKIDKDFNPPIKRYMKTTVYCYAPGKWAKIPYVSGKGILKVKVPLINGGTPLMFEVEGVKLWAVIGQ